MADQFLQLPITGGGVSSLNGLIGAITLVAGSNISITPSGNTLIIATTGAAPVTSVTASSPLSSSGGTTPNISISLATTSTNGYLSSTDWNTFNNKQPAGSYITALTGDATAAGPGSVPITLATVNGNIGSFGSASSVGAFTANAKGLITAASSISIQISEAQVTNLVSDLAGKQATGNYITALTGDVTATGPGSVAATIANLAVTNAKIANATIDLTTKVTGLLPIANGGTGQSTANTAFAALSPMTTDYDLITRIGGVPVRLAKGADGTHLTTKAGVVAWTVDPTPYSVSTINSSTSGVSGTTYLCDTSGGAFNLTLPTPVSGAFIIIKDKTGSFNTNNLTVLQNGSEQIEGLAASKILQTNWGSWSIFSDGTNWYMGPF